MPTVTARTRAVSTAWSTAATSRRRPWASTAASVTASRCSCGSWPEPLAACCRRSFAALSSGSLPRKGGREEYRTVPRVAGPLLHFHSPGRTIRVPLVNPRAFALTDLDAASGQAARPSRGRTANEACLLDGRVRGGPRVPRRRNESGDKDSKGAVVELDEVKSAVPADWK